MISDWQLVVVGGWWLVNGGRWQLAVVGGWRLVAAGGWRQLVVGGWWSLGAVPKGGPSQKQKKLVPQRTPLLLLGGGTGGAIGGLGAGVMLENMHVIL